MVAIFAAIFAIINHTGNTGYLYDLQLTRFLVTCIQTNYIFLLSRVDNLVVALTVLVQYHCPWRYNILKLASPSKKGIDPDQKGHIKFYNFNLNKLNWLHESPSDYNK